MSEILIRYTRPHEGTTEFRQQLVHRDDDCVVTLLERTPLERPVLVRGNIVLEPDAPVVWFTFPGLWHDVGRFHRRDGRFTGFYANILTPVRFVSADVWETTDLFLDVWLDDDGPLLLDEAELDRAVRDGILAPDRSARARCEAASLVMMSERGEWPPAVCEHWTLERARASLAGSRGTRGRHPV